MSISSATHGDYCNGGIAIMFVTLSSLGVKVVTVQHIQKRVLSILISPQRDFFRKQGEQRKADGCLQLISACTGLLRVIESAPIHVYLDSGNAKDMV